MGWTPLMIAASVKEADAIVDLLLQKGADVNIKSTPLRFHPLPYTIILTPCR
jgi:26S proteasome non-ATPase regulatory subunit 10